MASRRTPGTQTGEVVLQLQDRRTWLVQGTGSTGQERCRALQAGRVSGAVAGRPVSCRTKGEPKVTEEALPQRPLSLRQRQEVQALLLRQERRGRPRPESGSAAAAAVNGLLPTSAPRLLPIP